MAYRDKEKEKAYKREYWRTHEAYRKKNTERAPRSYYKHRDDYRKLVFDHYGWSCSCCGESHPDFLTLDHVNGGGRKHRAEVGNGRLMYRWIVKHGFPSDFRTLCFNCNCGRERTGGICPHEKERA